MRAGYLSIMKFVIQNKGPGLSRQAIVTNLPGCSGDNVMESPFCILYTHAGSVPHLTWDVLQHLKRGTDLPVLLTLPTVINIADAVREFGKGIGQFVGLGECISCVSIQDPASNTSSGYNDKTSVSVWTYNGRVKVSVDEFMKIQEAFKPCWYQALCDSDTPKDCSNKRLWHSVDRSLAMLDVCLEKHLKSEQLKNSAIFGTIQGGFNEKARYKSAKETSLRPVAGFVIDGFHSNGPDVETINFEEVAPLLRETVKLLPPDKPRIMNGPFTPSIILQAVECGVDIFDTSYPYLLTERGCALVLPDFTKCTEPLENFKYELNLNDKAYADDFSSLVHDCTCYTCQNFTKAYVHHLLKTSELLSSVLLMLHNLHVFLSFFDAIRKAIAEGKFENLKKVILRQ